MQSTAHRWIRRGICALSALFSLVATAATAGVEPPTLDYAAVSRALERASRAVVGVAAIAIEDARSNAMLGREREGSGVVIDADGLVLTIGYLVLEAEQVQLELDAGRIVPARVVAYDVSTGLGLLRPLVPLRVDPVPVAPGGTVPGADEPLIVISGGSDGGVGPAQLMSRRAFAGSWEYHIEGALFTAPQQPRHSGAGLFNLRGELLGIGSLALSDTLAEDDPRRMPGNMFVPVELLAPILPELLAQGSSSASRRAWMGLNCVALGGQLRVVRVNADSPADVAGVQHGDRIVAIDGTPVHTLDALWKTLWTGGGPEREVVLEILRGDTTHVLKVHTVDRMHTFSRATGI